MVAQFAVGAPTRAVDSDTSPFDVRIVPSAPDAEIDTEIVLGQPFAATCTVTNTAAIETFFDLDLHLPPTSAHGGRRADEAAVAQSAAGLLCLVDCVHVGTLGPGESARVPIELLAVSGPGVLTEVLDVAIAEGGADGGARFEVGVQVGVRVALSIADGETRVRAKTIGISGVAESVDGLNWCRVAGPLKGGAVLRPSDDPDAFDHIHLGLTDVTPLGGGSYSALYFGGSSEEVNLGMGPGPIKGFKMRPGAATSRDGLVWERTADSPLLDVGSVGSWDSNFCSWPRALPLDRSQPDGQWLMTYHALMPAGTDGVDAPRWAVGGALCEAGHALGPWTKVDGPILRGGVPGSFDEAGIGTRHVVHAPDGGDGLVMVYEGVGGDGRHRLGLATSVDGLSWSKVEGLGPDLGGPIFEGAPKDEDAWDNGNVGTPWVVALPSGGWRLYYVGTSDKGRAVAIGAAESDKLMSAEWRRVAVSKSGAVADWS